ncbi:N-acetylglucosamine-6-phosphate deacetylase [Roseibium sp.]|uniref:N-acetylglucosamine-6-phosphate deacetylase n=1 Tax=Roseibium sp. TaxID=1936156 RepID=UPI003BAE79BB
MEETRIFKGAIVLPDLVLPDGYLVCRNGKIDHVGPGNPWPNLPVQEVEILAPGCVDIHVHGGAGADFMDGTTAAVETVARSHAGHGTTTLFPTTTTGSFDELEAMVTACETVCDNWQPDRGARIAGVHFYGPYFAEDKTGVHAKTGRRDPVRSEYEHFLTRDIVRIATCAAELKGAAEFYRFAAARTSLLTCGHSNACWQEMEAAFRDGVRHVDHFWCAMSSVASLRKRFGTPMRAGMEQFVLANEAMSTEVIADGHHLSDDLLAFAYRMFGPHRLCLVTDANRALDCPPGTYRFGPEASGSLVVSNGETVCGADGSLASSMHGMDRMLRIMAKATGASLPDLFRMASLTPATLTGIAGDVGSLETGKRADILLLSEDLELRDVFVAGQKFRT